MIGTSRIKKYCKDFTKIENYELAKNDKTQIWCCHHKGKHWKLVEGKRVYY